MAFGGTIQLNTSYAIIGSIGISAIKGFTNVGIGIIVQVDEEMPMWNVDDIVAYDNRNVFTFQEGATSYNIVDQNFILFKYTPAP